MDTLVVGRDATLSLYYVMAGVYVPTCIVLRSDFVADGETLYALRCVLAESPQLSHLGGWVSREAWAGVCTVIVEAAARRRTPLFIALRPHNFKLCRREARTFSRRLRAAVVQPVYNSWAGEAWRRCE